MIAGRSTATSRGPRWLEAAGTLATVNRAPSPRRTAGSATTDGDARRTAHLLVDDGIVSGQLEPATVDLGALASFAARRVPSLPARVVQSATKRREGAAAFERDVQSAVALRRRLLGDGAQAPPRFLVRVDEFPHFLAWDEPGRYGSEGYRRFHEIMRGAGVPYLVAALPRVSRRPLNPRERASRPLEDDERALLSRVRSEGATVALHGRDHRTRTRSPRRRSELTGLGRRATAELLDTALEQLAEQTDVRPRVFVAPYNRFSAGQWPALAARFAVVGGGPESIRMLGIQPTPQWRDGAVYLPAYAPLYGRARDVLAEVERRLEQASGLWTPVVLHWGWEADAGWGDLERLAARLAPHAVDWSQFLAAVDRSR